MIVEKIRRTVLMMIAVLALSGGMAGAGDLMPLRPVPPNYVDKLMPTGWWTDPKVLEEGARIYFGQANVTNSCSSCHGKDGQPLKKGARDLRDQKNTGRFSDSYWYWRVAEGVPKTSMKPWKSLLTEEQIWQVVAFIHTFSHGGKPSEHTDYAP